MPVDHKPQPAADGMPWSRRLDSWHTSNRAQPLTPLHALPEMIYGVLNRVEAPRFQVIHFAKGSPA